MWIKQRRQAEEEMVEPGRTGWKSGLSSTALRGLVASLPGTEPLSLRWGHGMRKVMHPSSTPPSEKFQVQQEPHLQNVMALLSGAKVSFRGELKQSSTGKGVEIPSSLLG